ALVTKQLEGSRKIGLNERVPRTEPIPVTLVDRTSLGRMPEDHVEDRMQVRLRTRQLETLTREPDRRREKLLPRKRPVRALRLLEPDRCTRHGDRGPADPKLLGRAAGEV